jgi:threonine/homoserine/homoserine lactone efflux protein
MSTSAWLIYLGFSGVRHFIISGNDLLIQKEPTPGQTTKEDMALVRQMVSTYLQNPRSIILFVAPNS